MVDPTRWLGPGITLEGWVAGGLLFAYTAMHLIIGCLVGRQDALLGWRRQR